MAHIVPQICLLKHCKCDSTYRSRNKQYVRIIIISLVQERLASIPGRKERRISAWLKKAHHCAL